MIVSLRILGGFQDLRASHHISQILIPHLSLRQPLDNFGMNQLKPKLCNVDLRHLFYLFDLFQIFAPRWRQTVALLAAARLVRNSHLDQTGLEGRQ